MYIIYDKLYNCISIVPAYAQGNGLPYFTQDEREMQAPAAAERNDTGGQNKG